MFNGPMARLLSLIALSAGIISAQSAPPRQDIPTIAKTANGTIVSIVMSDKDGKAIAQGSRFLVSKDGLIVTNYHVIAEGKSAVVKFPDGAFYLVDGVVASDKARDVAVIKARGKGFRVLLLGNSDRVQVGEQVVAIGNPLLSNRRSRTALLAERERLKNKAGNSCKSPLRFRPAAAAAHCSTWPGR